MKFDYNIRKFAKVKGIDRIKSRKLHKGDVMLIIYLFLLVTGLIAYGIAWGIFHLAYLVRISIMTDSIRDKDDLLYLNIADYTHVIAELFKRSGYKVRMSDHFGEGGTGLILNELNYVVIRKDHYHHMVEIEAAKKLSKHMRDNGIYRGMIITLGDFKANTRSYCHINVITCINGTQLLQMLREAQSSNPVSAKLP